MQKPMKIMLISMVILFGGIFLYKFIVQIIIAKKMSERSQATAASVMKVGVSDWQKTIPVSGSMRAINGVNVTAELAGMVKEISIIPGSFVKKGDVLVQLSANTDIALLNAQKANAELAQLTYQRDKKQFDIKAISQQILDNDAARLKNIQAQVDQQQAVVNKKTIRAPFDGYIGLNYVNPGQYINPGDKITTLQSLDPLYADFFMPQQLLSELKTGQTVKLSVNTYPKKSFEGKITTIEPIVDNATRNVAIESIFDNKDKLLKPGMFVSLQVLIGGPKSFITIPQTAITFNSYGNIIYIVEKSKEKDAQGKPILTVKQRFVTTGETRGEQIQVLKGLKIGEEIVTSGQLKLRNGSQIVINNAIVPSDSPDPEVPNNHED